MKPTRALLAITVVTLVAAACGGSDDADTVGGGGVRTVAIEMVDTAFHPDHVDVTAGETVRFVFTNRGRTAHDAFVGDAAAQSEHEREMREDDDGHGAHGAGDDDAVTVEPGETEELRYTFDGSGSLEIGCHQPGHYRAGMKVTVDVG